MKIGLSPASHQHASTVFEIIRIFLPELSWHELTGDIQEAHLVLEIDIKEEQLMVGIVEGPAIVEQIKEPEPNELKRIIKLAVYRLFTEKLGFKASPWGTLIGIRPTKIVHRYWDQGLNQEEIEKTLQTNYLVERDKVRKLIEITKLQRKFLLSSKGAKNTVSIYISIPFCPTRCSYCSFPSFPVGKGSQEIDNYLKYLIQEIKGVGEALNEARINIQTLYVGGGTPTTLNLEQLNLFLGAIKEYLLQENTAEFTFEAGRPDTINEEKLLLLKKYGISRVSINPQSMCQETLTRIGILHSPDDIIAKFMLAKEIGFDINMDLIIGLPGEGPEEIRHTLKEIGKLKPENLTVHALALKRTAKLRENKAVSLLENQAAEMFAFAEEWCAANDYKPYYLYRQKQIVGNQENVGYFREKPCIYNIQMMEERQTIWGLGVGAGSKIVNPDDWTLINAYNPKDLILYGQRIEEIIKAKVDKIKTLG
ncbi:MAG: coproporphyrinogen dehydrogenase HemZ [Clostridia bacterium]|nr:coproporphyrinogen dehydrogenase HemZ [Clostridia bacterium]